MGKNILIIGNGFDLYHKLPTRYSDFMFLASEWNSFYNEYDSETVLTNSNEQISVPLGEKGELTHEALQEFGRHGKLFDPDHINYLNTELKRNTWIKYFTEIERSGEMRWVDFEAEIDNALSAVEEYSMKTIPNSVGHPVLNNIPDRLGRIARIFGGNASNGYCDMTHDLISLKDIDPPRLQANKILLIEFMHKELNGLILCLNYYLSEFVEHIYCDCYSEQVAALNDIDLLNFNYTDTYRRIYRKDQINHYHAVHGGIIENDIVLGIADDCFEEKPEYIRFKKFFQRIQKRTGAYYNEWFNERSQGFLLEKDVFIIGHSLGYADFGVLKHFFTQPAIGKITIFYHSQSSYEDLVINLVKALGKESVIESIGNGKIVFEELKAPVRRM